MIVDWYTRGAFNGITRGVISSTPDSALLRSLRASFGGVYGGGGGELADSADRPVVCFSCCFVLIFVGKIMPRLMLIGLLSV